MHDQNIEEFVSMFDAAFPEWRIGPYSGQPRRCLAFEIPAPSAAIEGSLAISVTAIAIVVRLHAAEQTFSDFAEAVAQIRSLVDEGSVVQSWYAGPYLRRAAFVVASERPLAGHLIRGETRITRRSWRGTHDLDLNVN